jgi:hypothetical protein
VNHRTFTHVDVGDWLNRPHGLPWGELRSVQDRPEVDNPAKQGNPENRRKHELDDCHKEPALKELTKTGNEKTAESRNDVAT